MTSSLAPPPQTQAVPVPAADSGAPSGAPASPVSAINTLKRAPPSPDHFESQSSATAADDNTNGGSAVAAPARAPKKSRVKAKKYKPPPVDPVGVEGTLRNDIADLLAAQNVDPASARNDMTAFFNRDRAASWPLHVEAELAIESLSSIGVGLALHNGKPVAVPFTVPGDRALVKIYRTEEYYLEGEVVKILEAAPTRDDARVNCQYFTTCSGCQYQFLDYAEQLRIKREVVVRAYRHQAPALWASGRLPAIHGTVGSPAQYAYRTKLTPHFDVPRGKSAAPLAAAPPVGFGIKGRSGVLDIEECAIGTPVVNAGMRTQRARVAAEWKTFRRGATLLSRETTLENGELAPVLDNREIVTEVVDGFKFRYRAGEFFQNNNSILPVVTEFVRGHLSIGGRPPRFLVDTYCGSGLFAVTCSAAVEQVVGVEISAEAIDFARKNAELNSVKNATFVVGEAEKIFDHVNSDPKHTAVVIDPPRKGCDTRFLDQLLQFAPAKIVYVSCNVHSQARDLEYFLARSDYVVQSLGGFDFFPQTHHVEGVAVLARPEAAHAGNLADLSEAPGAVPEADPATPPPTGAPAPAAAEAVAAVAEAPTASQ